ncbi:MAG: helix-hairpin-helix domain-containing protein [Caldisericaceae bacterium]
MEDFSVKQWLVIIVLITVITFGGGVILGKQLPRKSPAVVEDTITNVSAPEVPAQITVYITGAVKMPDVYKLKEGSIVKDGIIKAGGALESADLVAINLAKKLVDGEEVAVPYKTANSGTTNTATSQSDGKININTATKAELVSLPGIGDVKAQAIIDYRTKNGDFKRIEDIVNVSGIGQKTFDSLKDLIKVN